MWSKLLKLKSQKLKLTFLDKMGIHFDRVQLEGEVYKGEQKPQSIQEKECKYDTDTVTGINGGSDWKEQN